MKWQRFWPFRTRAQYATAALPLAETVMMTLGFAQTRAKQLGILHVGGGWAVLPEHPTLEQKTFVYELLSRGIVQNARRENQYIGYAFDISPDDVLLFDTPFENARLWPPGLVPRGDVIVQPRDVGFGHEHHFMMLPWDESLGEWTEFDNKTDPMLTKAVPEGIAFPMATFRDLYGCGCGMRVVQTAHALA